ncbi:DUF421 domain-containing protein [Paenibacillus sp. 481]|uniref:DUF421 domain-containing protein n=1 Tax=Paenibacillus sp. 481 TaxID=2835869 RepID=UPI003FA7B66D
MYFTVFVVLRLMGKREIGKLSIFDLVISIMIAEIAVFVIDETDRPLWEGFVPIAVLVVIQISLAHLTLKSRKLRHLFDGGPSIIIANGHLNRDEMRKQRYNLDDLMLQLREQGIENPGDVQYAILESTGKLTVFTVDDEEEQRNEGPSDAVTSGGAVSGKSDSEIADLESESEREREDVLGLLASAHQRQSQRRQVSRSAETGTTLGLRHPEKVRFTTLPLPLIMDGKVQDDNLQVINKTRFWLKNQLQFKGVNDFKNVFFCTIDHKGQLFVDQKHMKKN